MVWTVRAAVTATRAVAMAAAMVGVVYGSAVPAKAEPVIDITKGVVEPMPIAIPVFGGANPADNQLGGEIARVVAADLERSGLFAPIDQRAFIQQGVTADAVPRFQDWRLINAQALVAGSIKPVAGGKYSVEFRLWDVFGGAQMDAKSYTFTQDIWRRVSHIIADDIYKRITGEDGYFDTRIVYIAEIRPQGQPPEAPRHHGPGRREPSVPDQRRRPGADPALLARGPGHHLHVLLREQTARVSL